MQTDSVYKDALKVTGIIFILGMIEFLIFTLFMKFRTDILIGTLYGCAFSSANFFYLAYCVDKSVEKDEKAAKAYMSSTYTFRMLLTAAMVVVAAKVDCIYIWSAIIPLTFTRIAATIVPLLKNRRNKS